MSITNLSGTNFATNGYIRLKRSGYNPVVGYVTSLTSTRIAGTFDLTNQAPGVYQVCMYNDASNYVCDLSFTILSSASEGNGSINIKSAPTTSKVYLNNVYKGYTPLLLENITAGTYTVSVLRAGYYDYSESVKVTAGNTATVSASLVILPESTTAVVVPTTHARTVTTIKKSTLKLPTTWADVPTTAASPLDPAIIVGAAGIAMVLAVLLRR